MSAAACLKKIRCDYLASAEAQSMTDAVPVLQRAVDDGALSQEAMDRCLAKAAHIDEQFIAAYGELWEEIKRELG